MCSYCNLSFAYKSKLDRHFSRSSHKMFVSVQETDDAFGEDFDYDENQLSFQVSIVVTFDLRVYARNFSPVLMLRVNIQLMK